MVFHDRRFCKQLEIEILSVVRKSTHPLSLDEILTEINRRHNPRYSFYEVFHHAHRLVDKGDLTLETEGKRRTIVFKELLVGEQHG